MVLPFALSVPQHWSVIQGSDNNVVCKLEYEHRRATYRQELFSLCQALFHFFKLELKKAVSMTLALKLLKHQEELIKYTIYNV